MESSPFPKFTNFLFTKTSDILDETSFDLVTVFILGQLIELKFTKFLM